MKVHFCVCTLLYKNCRGKHVTHLCLQDADSAENAVGCNGNDIAGNVLSVTQREEGMLQQQFLNPVFLAGISRGKESN